MMKHFFKFFIFIIWIICFTVPTVFSAPVPFKAIVGSEPKYHENGSRLIEKKYVEITFEKQMIDNMIIYQYTVNNVGPIPIGKIEIGHNRPDLIGCEIPSAAILKIEQTKPDWTARLEKQEENINQCLALEDEEDHYVLQPGETITVRVYLKKDNPIFEKLHWYAILRNGQPTYMARLQKMMLVMKTHQCKKVKIKMNALWVSI